MSLADEKYMSVTTFKKDGTPKPAPVWPVDAGDARPARSQIGDKTVRASL